MFQVHSIKLQMKCTDKQACRLLAGEKRYAAQWGPPDDSKPAKWTETLESRLHDARTGYTNAYKSNKLMAAVAGIEPKRRSGK
jgi:hypothetical protein